MTWELAVAFSNIFLVYLCRKAEALNSHAPCSHVPIDSRSHPFIILPGFGNTFADYMGTDRTQGEFIRSLRQGGVQHVHCLDITRRCWLNVAKGVVSECGWKGTCEPNQVYSFYLERMKAKIFQLSHEHQSPCILVGHSAGGWLARALMADGTWNCPRNYPIQRSICGLVTLGTPHSPPDRPYIDPSRGALSFVDRNYPGAFLQHRGIFYLSVAGSAIRGDSSAAASNAEYFAAASYLRVNGNRLIYGEEDGDGIVPVSSALLSGAEQLVLPEVWHGSYNHKTLWYGSQDAVDQWLPIAMELLEENSCKQRKSSVPTRSLVESF